MGTLFSGVGLVSGLNIQQIVDQLIAVEARPRDQLITRMRSIDAQRTAFTDISARITALLGRVNALSRRDSFLAARAASSDSDVLSATASSTAQPGSYTFTVRGLAAAHQLVSRGFSGPNAGLSPGTLTIESARARVDRRTLLNELNGHTGVQRGSFQIVDSSGRTATIDIADAITLDDVVQRINDADVGVHADVRNDALVLTDERGGRLRVREVEGGRTAADLGFAAGRTSGDGSLAGATLMRLGRQTGLDALNDGLGLRRAAAGGDFRITDSSGGEIVVELSEVLQTDTRLERLNQANGVRLGTIRVTNRAGRVTEIDLTGAQTAGDIKQRIESADAGLSVVISGGRFVISDTTSATTNDLVIEDVENGTAARDLGIAGRSANPTLNGRQVLRVDTMADVLAAINYARGNLGQVTAAISDQDGRSIVLTDSGGGTTGRLVLTALNNSKALSDLGLREGAFDAEQPVAGRRILGGVNTVLLQTLNGGRGIDGGVIRISASGAATDVDLTGAETLRDVIDAINTASESAALGVRAGYDPTGTRLLITGDNDSAGEITISDVTGEMAAQLGLAQTGTRIRGDNLQRQYINERTRLADLNAGRGVQLGRLRITDSAGRSASIDLATGTLNTLQDVLDRINAAALGVRAEINATGDGLQLVDTAGGNLDLKVEEEGGRIARDLNILGQHRGTLDGSFEVRLEIGAGDTLADVRNRINQASGLVSASVVSDGTPTNPYRLSLTARQSGTAGELVVDGEALGLTFSTLSQARDARVLIGDGSTGGLLVTSSTNTITNIVEGVTLNLSGVSDQAVTVTVVRDTSAMVDTIRGLVSDFNSLLDRIKDLGAYDAESQSRGPLQGDATLRTIESRLFRSVTGALPGLAGNIRRLSQIGVRLDDKSRLTFDEERFRETYEADPEAVTSFFTTAASGLAARMKSQLEALTESDGMIPRRNRALENQKDLLNERVGQLNELLERRRTRLTRQFLAMEQALSGMQSQSAALGSIGALALPSQRQSGSA
jgi:flagellar hook-associated protein 2